MNYLRVHWKRFAVLSAVFGLGATGLIIASSPRGRFCDNRIGAVGHPYWRFSDGRVGIVACGQYEPHGTYRQTGSGWIWINDYKAEKYGPQTNQLELHWWGMSIGPGPGRSEFHRCWHLWMNSHGPLWHPWDT